MSELRLQNVQAANGKTYLVTWDDTAQQVYVQQVGPLFPSKKSIGKARSAKEAMAMAEAWSVQTR